MEICLDLIHTSPEHINISIARGAIGRQRSGQRDPWCQWPSSSLLDCKRHRKQIVALVLVRHGRGKLAESIRCAVFNTSSIEGGAPNDARHTATALFVLALPLSARHRPRRYVSQCCGIPAVAQHLAFRVELIRVRQAGWDSQTVEYGLNITDEVGVNSSGAQRTYSSWR